MGELAITVAAAGGEHGIECGAARTPPLPPPSASAMVSQEAETSSAMPGAVPTCAIPTTATAPPSAVPAHIAGPAPTFPAPASTSSGVIDHTAYPQIMDAVLSAAPYTALLAFRGTSKHYQARIDVLLSRHLSISDTELRTTLGRHPRLPLLIPQAVDCFTHYALQPAPHVPAAAGAGNVPLLRLRDAPLAIIDLLRPTTVVAFGWRRRGEPPETKWVVVGRAPRRASPVEHCGTVRKVVIVVDGLPDNECYAKGMVHAWPSIRDITVVYNPDARPQADAGTEGSDGGEGTVTLDTKIGNILYEMVPRVLGAGHPDLRLTLVNTDAMPPGAFPPHGRVSWWATDLVHGREAPLRCGSPRCPCAQDPVSRMSLREYVDVVRASFCSQIGGAPGDDPFRFLTMAEYEAELGADAFALETDPTFVLR